MEHKGTEENKKELKTGYIYSIRSFKTDNIYIGSTFNNLNKRMYGHRNKYKCYLKDNTKKCSKSRDILKHGDAYIELIKEVQVKNRLELNKYEGEEQRKNMNILVNCKIECRTPEEKKEKHKEYYEEHKEKYKGLFKEYYEKHKKELHQYYKDRKEKYKEKYKEYNEKNKERNSQKVNCLECNSFINKGNLKRHLKTKKHIKNSKTEI